MKRLLPAYPIFVHDPYFSYWINDEKFNTTDTQFWTGAKSSLYGLVKSDKNVYSFLGVMSKATPLKQVGLELTAFSTDCIYECDEFTLFVSFISPLLPTDLEIMSRPVCYLKYKLVSKIKDKKYQIMLAANENVCYETAGQMRGGTVKTENLNIAWFGLRNQKPLSQAGDTIKCNWGNYYVAGQYARYLPLWEIDSYARGNDMQYYYFDDAPRAICAYDEIEGDGVGKLMLAYDDTVSIYYFGEFLKGYYFANGKSIFDAISEADLGYKTTLEKLKDFNDRMKEESAIYGKEYLNILNASLRQTVAAHKLCCDKDGNLLFLSKECNSNGCIATVDVTYPSMPLFLKYNPDLVAAMIRPVLKFAKMPVWEYDFAPHDVGTYPYCSGQSYGITGDNCERHENICRRNDEACSILHILPKGCDIYNLNSQMPIEECANMLIISLSLVEFGGDKKLVQENLPTLKLWADYLVKNYMSSGNQLCTDDFAGHLAGNVNLSIKAVVGIGCFAKLCEIYGDTQLSTYYLDKSEKYSSEFNKKYKNAAHTPLTFDTDEQTYSIKYNFAFDVILKLGLFDKQIMEKDIDFLVKNCGEYGTPLDNRKRYTKSDWQMWCAVLTEDMEKRKFIISKINKYLTESVSRVPFSDWYDTDSGMYLEFKNRSVQGAAFIMLIENAKKV